MHPGEGKAIDVRDENRRDGGGQARISAAESLAYDLGDVIDARAGENLFAFV